MLTLNIKTRHVTVALLMVAGLVLAAPLSGIDGLPRWLKAGFWAGPAAVQAVAANKVTVMASASTAFNFDAGGAGDVKVGPPLTVTGATLGDTCIISADRAALGLNSNVYCDVTASNTVLFWVETTKADTNPGDAGFYVQVISHQ